MESNTNRLEVVYKPTIKTRDGVIMESDKTQNCSPTIYLTVSIVNLALLSSSTSLVWSSPVLPYLLSNDTNINPLGQPITASQTSLISGLPYLGGVIFPLAFGKLCDIYGRRKIMLLMAMLTLVMFVVLATARSIYVYYIARTVLGGLLYYSFIVNNIYGNEIAEDHNRAKLSCLLIVSHVLGILYGYILGLFFNVRNYTLVCAAPLIVSITGMLFFVPESPYYLVKHDESQAIEVLRKLRQRHEVSKDIQKIKDTVNNVEGHDKSSWRRLLSDPVNRRACIICIGAMSLNLFSGTTAIMAFSGSIFNSIGVPGNLVSVALGLVKFSMTVVAFVIVGKFGKKKLMLVSATGCSLSHLTVGAYFYLRSIELDGIESFALIPAVSVLLYIGFYGVGLGIGATALTGELFADDVKTAGNSLVFVQSALLGFAVTSLFPLVTHYLGMYWPFFMFSVICAAGLIFIWYFVPKTDDKSFLEIQEILRKKISKK